MESSRPDGLLWVFMWSPLGAPLGCPMHSSRYSEGFLDAYVDSAISSYGFLNVLEVFRWIPLGPMGASGYSYGFHAVCSRLSHAFLELFP